MSLILPPDAMAKANRTKHVSQTPSFWRVQCFAIAATATWLGIGSQTHAADFVAHDIYVEGTLVALQRSGTMPGRRDFFAVNEVPYASPHSASWSSESLPSFRPCETQRSPCCQQYGMLFSELMRDTKQDCRRFYSPRTLGLFALGFGGAAAFANSELDNDFQRWYDEEIKNKTTDDFSSFVSDFGNGRIVVPALVATYLLGPLCARDHASPTVTCSTSIVAEWSNRCVRSLLVGGPPVLAMKYLLNASRPEDEISSRWRSFASPQSEGAVSGHAFVGATPFLNAARMTDRVGLKAALYCMSTWPAWSRVNDRMHYLSQAMLGWWIAYLATEVVDHTERDRRNFVIVPQIMDGGPGIGAVCWW